MHQLKLRVFSSGDIKRCIDMKDAILAMREAFRAVSAKEAMMPLRSGFELNEQNGVTLFMPAYLPALRHISLKTVTTYRNNAAKGLPAIHALVQLFDAETGRPLALIDGESLTALRTGAASGLATELLARHDASRVAIIGAGVQGRSQLEAVCCARRISTAFVIDLSKKAVEDFVDEMGRRLAIEVLPAGVDALKESNIICTATSSRVPLFDHEMLAPLVHINAIGAFRSDMCEIPAATVRAATVYVDQFEACRKEAGDLLQPLAAGIIDENHFNREIGSLLVERNVGAPMHNNPITLFKSVGIAAQDLVLASLVYQRGVEMGLGAEVIL